MVSTDSIKAKLIQKSTYLGFDDLKICNTDDFSQDSADRLSKWLDDEMFDKMNFLVRAKDAKISPRKYFPLAKSAICVCANFYRKTQEHRIALYAQSKDYHDVIKPKLIELAKVLEEYGGQQRVSVDTTALWEKLLAQRSGLGWIGKNTLLIRKENGPWNFIGIILTSLQLPIDEQVENRCGTCNRCVQACPTSAITENGIDTRLCISNLTIERKGDITDKEKSLLSDSIFGCDKCLRACPYTNPQKTPLITDFNSVIKLSQNPTFEEIQEKANDTPIKRGLKNIKNLFFNE